MKPVRQLQLLESTSSVSDFLRRSARELPSEPGSSHSLMRALGFVGMFPVEVMEAVLKRFTRPGDRVLDPFCGTGLIGLYAQLQGRIALMSDSDRSVLELAEAMTNPIGLDEVVLRVHQLALGRPRSLAAFSDHFKPFFHPDTFFELMNLRDAIRTSNNPRDRFLGLLAVSRLHGHTKSYFSAYSSPAFALHPEKQEEVNRRRRAVPEYRALAPRLIKRAAELLEDGIPGRFYDVLPERRIHCADARRLDWVESSSVDLVFSAPPLPAESGFLDEQWLTRWFLRENAEPPKQLRNSTLEEWGEDITRVLSEGLRVLRPGGYLAFQLGRYAGESEGSEVSLEDFVAERAELIRSAQKKFRIHEMLVLKVSRDRMLSLVERNKSLREPRVLVLRAQSYA